MSKLLAVATEIHSLKISCDSIFILFAIVADFAHIFADVFYDR